MKAARPGRRALRRRAAARRRHVLRMVSRRWFWLIAVGAFLIGAGLGHAQEGSDPLALVDVPFLAQSEELCGGAAAAMVLRYWGIQDVQPEDFAPLVDAAKGGISAPDLVDALSSRGVVPRTIRAEGSDVAVEVEKGRPVIALVDGGGGRFHYVVIVAWKNDHVLFHDPSVGPFRLESQASFENRWRPTEGLAILTTPKLRESREPPTIDDPTPAPQGGLCDVLVDPAIVTARGLDPEAAVPPLSAAVELCPSEARALGALAGVRFRQERWRESAHFATQALNRDPADEETWRLLGASLYLADEPKAALKAWNHIGEPRIDRVSIGGLRRTRQDLATAILGLKGRDVLTVDSVAGAQRRLEHMPTSTGARVTYRPENEGRAEVVATVGEARLTEPWLFLAARLAIKGAVRRELSVRFNSPTGHGESAHLGWRYEDHRPSFWVSIDTPRLAGVPGVVSISGLWDRQTYRLNPEGVEVQVETRRRGSARWSHWVHAQARIEGGFALDRFEDRGEFASARVGGEIRLGQDRVALLGDLELWAALGDGPSFSEMGGMLALRSSAQPEAFLISARFGGRRATGEAPLAIWPGAGTGPGRPLLLRASPLLENGELVGEGFGRGLLHATVEAEIRVAENGPGRLSLAAFGDWAKPWDTIVQRGSGQDVFSVGLGLRLRTFSGVAFRADLAVRPGRRDVVLSAGVIPRWGF